MTKKFYTREDVLDAAKKIGTEINQQIPLASNRYRPSIEEEQHFDEELEHAEIEYYLNQHITSLFHKYTQQNQLIDKELSSYEKNNFITMAIDAVSTVYEEIKVVKQILQKPLQVTLDRLRDDLKKTIEQKIKTLQNKQPLTISNKTLEEKHQFSKRMALDDELVKHRKILKKQTISISTAYAQDQQEGVSDHDKLFNDLIKLTYLTTGYHYNQTKCGTGYCGEHASLALYKFFESSLIFYVNSLEVISLGWLNNEGKAIDNHCFIAINREPNSELKDTKTWGKEAVLLDPWNQLVCYANEFHMIPDEYYDYSIQGSWESMVYTKKDYDIYSHLDNNQQDYAITENLDLEKRRPIIMDEYQLTSLETKNYQQTHHLLLELAEKSRPSHFQTPIDFLITTCSNQLIMPILGLKKISIAVHKDFFKLIQEGKAAVTDLQMGIACTQYEILHHGLIGEQFDLNFDRYFKCDRDLIAHCHNGDGLIRYLRLCHDFLKSHQDQNHQLKNNLLDCLDMDKQQKAIEQRIKAIKTLLASQEHVSIQPKEMLLPQSIAKELAPLSFKTYFTDGFNTKKTIVDQLNHLTSCLPDLKIELIPYELHPNSLSRRVREFCALLESMPIDLKNQQHFFAANKLIQHAYDSRVPGFDQIYIAITKPPKNQYGEAAAQMLALGPFLKVNELIKKIANSMSYCEASTLAKQFVTLWESEFMKLFDDYGAGRTRYLRDFYQTHHTYPTGNSRYFGSNIGKHISLDQSAQNTKTLLTHMIQHADQPIAKLFYILGNHSQEVLSTLSPDDLFTLMRQYDDHTVNGFEFNHDSQINTFKHIISRKGLITDMFDTTMSFKEKVALFIKQNKDLLTTPHTYPREEPTQNFNGKATQYLLKQFIHIAQWGTKEEQLVIKEFFLNKNTPNSLHSIQYHFNSRRQELSYDSLWVQFVIEGKYQNTPVALFTPEEKMAFYLHSDVFHGQCRLPVKRYINLFNLQDQTLTLECLTKIVHQLAQYHVCTPAPIGDLLEEHLKQIKPYTLMSEDTQKIITLIQKTCPYLLSNLMKTIQWNLPDLASQLSFEPLKHLAFLYRALNASARWPSLQHQLDYQQLLIKGIQQSEGDKSMELLALILFNPDFSEPISDYQFTKTLIDVFITATIKQHTVDDGSDVYFNQIKPLLQRIAQHTPARDKETVLAKLLDSIQAQNKVCQFVHSTVHTIRLKTYKEGLKEGLDDQENNKISGLSALSLYFGAAKKDQHELIEFLSSPLSDSSLKQFSHFIIHHPKRDEILKTIGGTQNQVINHKDMIRHYNISLYHHFWDTSLEERAVIFDHLLTPAQHTSSENKEKAAYQEALEWVGKRLFPNADKEQSDDHFAMALLSAYLDTSNTHQRGILLAGLLVASNKQDHSTALTTGKKIASLCEHMGPAYVKLAQAIHSYPSTPPSLRQDIAHMKGHANPPKRWELWRLIEQRVHQKDRDKIQYVGRLLGSASYNLALEVTLQDGTQAVLILLRDQAALHANKGFNHLRKTITHCQHERMNSIREPMSSILEEAEKQSIVEMDPIASQKQFVLAQALYKSSRFKITSHDYDFDIKTAQFIFGNDGYRVITKLEGTAFNELPTKTQDEIRLKKEVAKAIMTIELTNILSGLPFDSDRHGHQMRVKADGHKVQLGLFDFGEMALEKPSEHDIALFCKALSDLPGALLTCRSFDAAFESILSKHIHSEPHQAKKHYLMRVRKAILALHDFQMELTHDELISIIKNMTKSTEIHHKIRGTLIEILDSLSLYSFTNQVTHHITSLFTGLINGVSHTFFGASIIHEEEKKEHEQATPFNQSPLARSKK